MRRKTREICDEFLRTCSNFDNAEMIQVWEYLQQRWPIARIEDATIEYLNLPTKLIHNLKSDFDTPENHLAGFDEHQYLQPMRQVKHLHSVPSHILVYRPGIGEDYLGIIRQAFRDQGVAW